MKSKILVSLLTALTLSGTLGVRAQGTAFSYQGQLNDGANPANGTYDLRFAIYDSSGGLTVVAGPLTNSPVGVTNGLFAVTLDFGSGVFTGPPRWLEIAVKSNGVAGPPTTLSPRQRLTAAPYAITAGNLTGLLPASQLTGTLPSALLSGTYSQPLSFTGSNTFVGNGGGLTNVSGALPWRSVDGVLAQAQANAAYMITNAAHVALNLPATANVGDIVRVHGLGAGGWEVNINPGQTILGYEAGLDWTPRADSRSWEGIACSADGTKVVAVAANDRIYTSSDHGVTWTPRETNRYWMSVASSADGTQLAAVDWYGTGSGGQTYTSSDAGVTWTPRGPQANWMTVASSADGRKLVAAGLGTRIHTSTNYGLTWAASETSREWISVASSGDGTKLIAVAAYGQIYTSSDSGTTWTPRDSPREWWEVASSSDGTKLYAATRYQRIYTAGTTYSGVAGGVGELQYVGGGRWQPMHDGSALTGLNASHLESGTVPLQRLPENIALLDQSQVFYGTNQFFRDAYFVNRVVFSFRTEHYQPAIFHGGYQQVLNLWETNYGIGVQPDTLYFRTASDVASGFAWFKGGSAAFFQPFDPGPGGTTLMSLTSAGLNVNAPGLFNSGLTSRSAGGFFDPQLLLQQTNAADWARLRLQSGGGPAWDIALAPGPQPVLNFFNGSANVLSLAQQGDATLAGNLTFTPGVPRQMLDLWNGQHAVGVQAWTTYFRTIGDPAGAFAWYRGGVHADPQYDAGGGQELMRLNNGGLWVQGAIVLTSDRNAKENITPVNPRKVLHKVAALPISTWNFKDDPATPHLGPMAQDFHAAFGVGADDKHIATVDADGVALAAIQGLNEKVEAENRNLRNDLQVKEAELKTLRSELSDLRKLVEHALAGKAR